MNKFIAFGLGLLFLATPAFAAAPLGVSGQADTSNQYPPVIQVPNSLATNIGGGKALLETGNTNILGNPSFEGSTFGTFWTLAAGTTALDTTTVIDGKKSLKVTLASQALNLAQDSTLYAAQFADSVQGLAMVRVKTSVSGIKVCSRQAGTTSTSLCVDVQANNKWGLYKIPFILGATSNGIAIHSNAVSVTGDVYVDAGFVGAVDLKQDVDASRLVGATYFAGTTSCNWSRTSTTVGAFTATAACPAPTVETTAVMGSWQLTDTDLPRQQILNLPRGRYKATFILEMILGAGASSSFAINDGTTTCYPISSSTNNSAGAQTVVECSFDYSQAGDRTFELYGASSASSLTITNNRTTPAAGTKFILEYYGNSSTYSSTNADTDPAPCVFSTLAWQGLGTVTNNLYCNKEGGELVISGRLQTGTVAASIAQIPLPLWSGNQLTTRSSIHTTGVISYGRIVRGISTTGPKEMAVIGSAGSTVLNLSYLDNTSTQNPLTALNGSALVGSSENLSIEEIRIPIEGWGNSNIIIGQFNGLETCTTTDSCTDTFRAYVNTSGAISRTNISNWITSGAASTGVYSVTFASNAFPNSLPVCSCNNEQGNARGCTINIVSNTSATIVTYTAANTLASADFSISCSRTGADAVFKTARAVASDQNVATPGVLKAEAFSFSYGAAAATACSTGTCAYLDQIGAAVSSVVFASTGTYTINFSKTYSKVKCSSNSVGAAGGGNDPVSCSSCNSVSMLTRATTTGSVQNSYGTVFCHGYTP